MKERYDERQEQIVNKIGAWSFLVMFSVCTMVIIAELIWKGSLEFVMGETLVLFAGGIVCLIGTIKNGMWTKSGKTMTVGQNLILSVLFSAVFTVFYAMTMLRKIGAGGNIGKIVLLFFLGIAVLGFLVLSGMGYMAKRQQEIQEQKYDDGK